MRIRDKVTNRLLVTGFGPFGAETVNPSGLVAAELGGLVLPVDAAGAWELTKRELKRRRVSAVLALGVAGGRERVCVERRAANAADYAIPDDAGRLLHGPLHPGGPTMMETRWGSPAAVARVIRRRGVAARVSRDAGRYVCNHFYFLLLHHLEGRALFLHLPRLPEVEAARGGGGPTLPFEEGLRAVRAALRVLGQEEAGLRTPPLPRGNPRHALLAPRFPAGGRGRPPV